MTTRIIIARHGNTFTKEQTPTRVGCRTDLDLVETDRGTNVGRYLKQENLVPDMVYAAPLKRTRKTAELAIAAMGKDIPFALDDSFVEIDYGPDENKTEAEVIARIGQEAIDKWNESAIVPDGWVVSVDGIVNAWKNFAQKVEGEFKDKTVLAVSSNGIIRFAPYLTGDFDGFCREHDIKVGTGSVCIFEKEDNDKHWKCKGWNIKPKDKLV
jgi:probable phosphoglycerate mutase